MAATSFPKPPVKTKRKSIAPKHQQMISVIALAVAIIALISAAFAWQQIASVQSSNDSHAMRLEQSVLQLKQALGKNQATLQDAIAANQKNIAQLMSQGGDNTTQQALGEARYLIRLAHLNLTMDNNVKLAITLLKMAKQRLAPISTPIATRLKNAIAHDVATLSAMPQINITDLLTQLDNISNQIAMLPTQPQLSPQTKTPVTTQSTAPHWWDRLKHNLGGLKRLFIVRHFDKPIAPLLMPQQAVYLKDNIRLKLSQAQWAVLHRAPQLYRQSLNLAVQWLNQYNQNQPATVHIIKKLQALAMIDINPEIPTTLQSLKALHTTTGSQTEHTEQ